MPPNPRACLRLQRLATPMTAAIAAAPAPLPPGGWTATADWRLLLTAFHGTTQPRCVQTALMP